MKIAIPAGSVNVQTAMSPEGNHRLAHPVRFAIADLRTFAAQGAICGVLSFLFVTVFRIFYAPSFYNVVVVGVFFFYIVPSGVIGAVAATFVWLLREMLLPRVGSLAHCVVGIATASVMAIPFIREDPSWRFFLLCAIPGCCAGLLTAVIVRAVRNPLRLVVLGPGSSARQRFWWLYSVAGFPLRLGGLYGALTALTILAWLFSDALAGWGDFANEARWSMLVGTSLALGYFTVSTLVGCTLPSRLALVCIAALLNTPLAIWTLNPGHAETDYLAIWIWVFISAWLVLTVCRLIAGPESRVEHESQRSAGEDL